MAKVFGLLSKSGDRRGNCAGSSLSVCRRGSLVVWASSLHLELSAAVWPMPFWPMSAKRSHQQLRFTLFLLGLLTFGDGNQVSHGGEAPFTCTSSWSEIGSTGSWNIPHFLISLSKINDDFCVVIRGRTPLAGSLDGHPHCSMHSWLAFRGGCPSIRMVQSHHGSWSAMNSCIMLLVACAPKKGHNNKCLCENAGVDPAKWECKFHRMSNVHCVPCPLLSKSDEPWGSCCPCSRVKTTASPNDCVTCPFGIPPTLAPRFSLDESTGPQSGKSEQAVFWLECPEWKLASV